MNTEKKKIIYISVRSDFGGGTYHIDLLIDNLSDEFDIYVAAPLNKPYGFKWQETPGKNRFFELPFRSFKVRSFFNLIKFIKKNKIEISHAHGKGGGIYGRLIKIFIPGLFVIYTPNGFHILHYNLLMQKVYILVERCLSRFTNLFINVSRGEKKVFMTHKIFKESDSIVVYNAIKNVERISFDKNELWNKLSLPEDKFLIISVVRFNHQKNLKATLSIAEKLLANQDILFLIVGDGEEREEIENIISKKNLTNILLLGYKSNIDECLWASDIYLSTSLWEGLPYSLIEAAATGLPIVASDVIGNNEVVVDGENGYLFQLNNPDDAVDKILRIKNSKPEQKLLSENSLKIFNGKFLLDIMINKMKEIYNSVNLDKE